MRRVGPKVAVRQWQAYAPAAKMENALRPVQMRLVRSAAAHRPAALQVLMAATMPQTMLVKPSVVVKWLG